jgi:hypothetical protein
MRRACCSALRKFGGDSVGDVDVTCMICHVTCMICHVTCMICHVTCMICHVTCMICEKI